MNSQNTQYTQPQVHVTGNTCIRLQLLTIHMYMDRPTYMVYLSR